MAENKVIELILDALKQGMEEPTEHRLYRSGKVNGLFGGKSGIHAEAVSQALADGLIEIFRTETKGKSTVEWAKVTQKGIDFLISRESPVRILEELKTALAATQEGIPLWLAQLRQTLHELGKKMTDEVLAMAHRFEKLSVQVRQALDQSAFPPTQLPQASVSAYPWALDAIAYLDRRRQGGILHSCPLSELFRTIREKQKDLTVGDFHAGLRHLHDRGLFRLLPWEGNGEIPEPEYALVDGPAVFTSVARG